MKQEEIIEQRKKELLLREEKKEQELIKKQNELQSAKKLDELWDRLLEANKKLDPVIRLSTRVKYKGKDSADNEVQTIGPLYKYKTGAEIIFDTSQTPWSTGIRLTSKYGIYESDNNILPDKLFVHNHHCSRDNKTWCPLRIVYDVEKIKFIVEIVEASSDGENNCTGLYRKDYELNIEDVDVLLNNIICGQLLYNGLKRLKSTKGGCFIATAVYGTPYSNEVLVLKEFRDNWLLNYSLGRVFVRFYYKVSPPFANQIAKQKYLKEITKTILIIPLITLANYLKRKTN